MFQAENIPQNLVVLKRVIKVLFLITASLGNLLISSWEDIFYLLFFECIALWTRNFKSCCWSCPFSPCCCFLYIELANRRKAGTVSVYFGPWIHSLLCLIRYVVCPCWLWQPSEQIGIMLISSPFNVSRVLSYFFWLVSTSLASLILWNDSDIFLVVMGLVVGIGLCCRCWSIWKLIASFDVKFRPRERPSKHVGRFKGTAANAFLMIHYFILLCHSPLFTTLLLTSNEDKIDSASWKKADGAVAWKLTSTIVFMNSALNPFIY